MISVKVTATDGSNASVSGPFDVTVANTNDAPVLDHSIDAQDASEGSAFSFVWSAVIPPGKAGGYYAE